MPFDNADITYFVDGSCKKSDTGTNNTGYAVVTRDQVIEAGKLPNSYSAQQAEIIALTNYQKNATQ